MAMSSETLGFGSLWGALLEWAKTYRSSALVEGAALEAATLAGVAVRVLDHISTGVARGVSARVSRERLKEK